MSLVRYETDGAVALLTLDRPPMNPFSAELIADLEEAVEQASDDAIRAVIVTGAPNFAAGADITAFKAAMSAGEGGAGVGLSLSRAFRRLEALPKPVIAAVRGYALGGGLELAMACDLRVMAEDAQVGQPEIRLGIIPGAGGTQRLTRLVGQGRARDLVYTGRRITGTEAFAWGLADRVVPADDLDEVATRLARELAAGPTRAIAIAKRLIATGASLPLGEALTLEEEGFVEVFATADAAEGVDAFLAKRPPEFTGR